MILDPASLVIHCPAALGRIYPDVERSSMAGGRTRGYVKEFEHAVIQETILGVRQIQRLMTFYWESALDFSRSLKGARHSVLYFLLTSHTSRRKMTEGCLLGDQENKEGL